MTEKRKEAWLGNAPGGNYTAKVSALAQKEGVGVHQIGVAHDDDCAVFRGNPCNCDPDVFLMKE